MDNGNKIIVIVGTNASGKSSLAIKLAKKYDGEVISADSRQVYRGLDIATGKVSPEEMDGIPHHLINVANPTETYTAGNFARDGRGALQDILARGKVPIVAGGTGFYIEALLNPNSFSPVPPNISLRKELEPLSPEKLLSRLKEIDPKRAEDIEDKNEQHNIHRLIRAIEVASSSVPEISSAQELPLDILWIGIQWDKENLAERIHSRTLERIENGMIEEAKQLLERGVSFERMQSLGLEYKHLADYLREMISRDELIERIETGDRQYAKQQRTWFKRNKKINWFKGDELKDIKQLVEEFLIRI